jgi:N-dimethylarginine dimethylaminohydrolase
MHEMDRPSSYGESGMEPLALNIRNEFGQIRSALVHDASTVVPVSGLAKIRRLYGSDFDGEEQYHPESGIWQVDRLREQVAGLHQTLRDQGVALTTTDNIEDAWLQFFVRDLGFVVGDTFYLANPAGKVRGLERKSLDRIRARFVNCRELATASIEGGDVFVHQDKVFVGLGRRTTRAAVNELRAYTEAQGFECIPIECDASVLHLDCRFNILGPETAVLSPRGIKPGAIRLLEKYFDCLPLTAEDDRQLASNYCLLSNELAISSRNNQAINALLSREGFSVIELDYSEPIKLWGSIRCTVCPLWRD